MREIQVYSVWYAYRALSFTRDNEINIASYPENNNEINVHAHRDLVYKKQWCSVVFGSSKRFIRDKDSSFFRNGSKPPIMFTFCLN